MRKAYIAFAILLSAAVVPGQSSSRASELKQLKKEAIVLREQLQELEEVIKTREEIDRLKKALDAAKRGKRPVKKKADVASKVIEIRPRWQPPNMRPGEVTIVQDHKGTWWYYEKRDVNGEVGVYEFATRQLAADFMNRVVELHSTRFRYVPLEDFVNRATKRKK